MGLTRNIGASHNDNLGAVAVFVQSFFRIKAIGLTYARETTLLHSSISRIIKL
jgi:hypothetical protein